MSLTPANTCFASVNDTSEEFFAGVVDTVKLSKTVKVSLTGVVDTGEELFTGVNHYGNACIAGVVDTGEAPK